MSQLHAMPIVLDSLHHLVLTVASIEKTSAFYQGVLGMTAREFKPGLYALHFGAQKINLHEAGTVVDINVRHAAAGSGDLCFLTKMPLEEVMAHLQAEGVAIVQGPVGATGACQKLRSVDIYDPDENLIEIANEV